MSLTTQNLIDLFMDHMGDTIATGSYWSNAKVVRYLNTAHESLRGIVADEDPDGEHMSVEADATYPASTRWYGFSGVGRWTTAGRPLRVIDVRSISAAAANEVGTPIECVEARMEYDHSSMYSGRFYMLQGDNIGLRDGGAAPTTAVVLRIRFVPASTRMSEASLAAVPAFVEGFYECIPAKAAVLAQQGESRPINDIATLSDELERGLKDYLRKKRHSTRPGVRVSQEMRGYYDFGR